MAKDSHDSYTAPPAMVTVRDREDCGHELVFTGFDLPGLSLGPDISINGVTCDTLDWPAPRTVVAGVPAGIEGKARVVVAYGPAPMFTFDIDLVPGATWAP